jgi:Ca-activated chloride channel family protein
VSRWRGPPRLWASALALLPLFGSHDQAEQAVRDGNALYEEGRYGAALERYEAAAGLRPNEGIIAFNEGNAWYRQGDTDKALEHYMASLGTEDPALRSRAKFNIGVIRLRQATAAERTPGQALPQAQAAIRYFRESLELDRGLADARYNLELGLGFLHQLEERLAQQQQSESRRINDAFLRRGQAQQEAQPGQRQSQNRPKDTHAERSDELPEQFAAKDRPPEQGQAPQPVSSSPQSATELLERLLKEIAAMETWRQETRRAALQAPGERDPW